MHAFSVWHWLVALAVVCVSVWLPSGPGVTIATLFPDAEGAESTASLFSVAVRAATRA